ncbi:MAG TPA: hypothetical protein PKD84_04595 [Propionicimonas sp.]|nr:hypothetical protein [Propionicimonas sp.]
MLKPAVLIPLVSVLGLGAAAVLTASVGSFAESAPQPRPAVSIGATTAKPLPSATSGPAGTSAAAPGATTSTRPAGTTTSTAPKTPTHEPTGTPTGTGKRQQGKPVSNPGPRHG